MWLCTKRGFYSIVRKGRGEIHVRARCREDLENLCQLIQRPRLTIHHSKPADYRWRLVVDEAVLGLIMAALAEDLDYANFKGVIAGDPDQYAKLRSYFDFHNDMEKWQSKYGEKKAWHSQ